MLRRHLWRWTTIAALAISATVAFALPSTAAAADEARCTTYPSTRCSLPAQPATAGLKHVGWAYLNLNYCAPGHMCAAIYRMNTPAWSWTGSAWRQTSLGQGWVYVYPYTGEWRWAWTQQTGWVAISGGRFELRSF